MARSTSEGAALHVAIPNQLLCAKTWIYSISGGTISNYFTHNPVCIDSKYTVNMEKFAEQIEINYVDVDIWVEIHSSSDFVRICL